MCNINVENVWYRNWRHKTLRNGVAQLAMLCAIGAVTLGSLFVTPASYAVEEVPSQQMEERYSPAPPPAESRPIDEFSASARDALPGEVVRLAGRCTPAVCIQIEFDPVGGGVDGAFYGFTGYDPETGKFDVEFTIPQVATPGDYRLSFRGINDEHTYTFFVPDFVFAVLDPAAPIPPAVLPPERPPVEQDTFIATENVAPRAELAATGSPLAASAAVATALALAGAAMLILRRTRTAKPSA